MKSSWIVSVGSRRKNSHMRRLAKSFSTTSTPSFSKHSRGTGRQYLSSAMASEVLLDDDYDYEDDQEWVMNNNNHRVVRGGGQQQPQERSPIFVAATRQHVGKTTTSLALMSGLHKRFNRVGFMKPVGQVSRHVTDVDGKDVIVDKDVAVVREHFGLDHLKYRDMSPLLIPRGYTRDYVDGVVTGDVQRERILTSYERIEASSDVVLCEGTGHVGVGSVVGANNAQVANWLGAKMVLVANGGLGSTYDLLQLNRLMCEYHNVEVAGVVVNRVQNEKYDEIRDYLERALLENWGIPLLACIPDRPFLGCPALADVEILLEGSFMLAGEENKLKHYRKENIDMVSTSLDCFLSDLRTNNARSLYICDASRGDIILGFAMEYHRMRSKGLSDQFEAALVVTGINEDRGVCSSVLDIIKCLDAPPILLARQPTSHVMSKILNFTPKHNSADSNRVAVAVNHYEAYIDFDRLLELTGNTLGEAASQRISMA